MWPCVPRTVTVALRLPRRPILIMSPSAATLVGSPTRQASSFSPRAASQSSSLLGAVDRDAFLVAGDEKADRAAEIRAARAEKLRRRRREAGDRALHVGGAAADEHAVAHRRRERIARPGLARPGRHHVGMAGEAEIAPARADPRIEIEDRLGAGSRKFLQLAAKAELRQLGGEMRQRAGIVRRDAGPRDQRLGQRQRVNRCGRGRSRRAAAR